MKHYIPSRRGILVYVFLLFLSLSATAQYNNSIYFAKTEINPLDSQKLFLKISNANFINNNEFYGDFVDGYTLIGFHLTPELVYFPTKRVKLKAGAHLLKYYGLESFSSVIPVFSFQFTLTPSLSMIFGSLYGTVNHKLIEPLYEFERFFVKNHEGGIQFLLKTGFLESDTWLNWERFIIEGDPFQEEFTMGTSNIAKLTQDGAKIELSIPFQMIASHKGGQISSIDGNIETIVNTAAGILVRKKFSDRGFKYIELSNYFLSYHDLSHTKTLPYSQGLGVYSNLIAEWRSLTIGAGYWYADRYITKRGRPVFHTVSVKDPLYFEETRQLITSKIMLNKRVGKEVGIGLRFETYYDLLNKKLNYTYGFHIIYNQRFFLKKAASSL
jgi:hypothetical protein